MRRERITSAQGSYAVEFTRDATAPSGRFHRGRFEMASGPIAKYRMTGAIISTSHAGAGTG
jgi:hypothetical protein